MTMRYAKGYIELNDTKDFPLLRQVLRSGYVTHRQLFEFMRLGAYEHSRPSFNWRVQRLVAHDLIARNELPGYGRNFVYSVASAGAEYLVSKGEFFIGLPAEKGRAQREAAVHHAVDVNEIYFALAKTGRLVSWAWEIEIRSQNELTGFGFQKDYDAIVTLRGLSGPADFALEYERRPKTLAQYRVIRKAIEREERVDRFVYLVSNYHLHTLLRRVFRGTKRALFIGSSGDVLEGQLSAPLEDVRNGRQRELGEVIEQ